jgi:hypothetical protein
MAGTRKGTYKVVNWRKYNESLVQRGSITFWFSEEVIAQGRHALRRGAGLVWRRQLHGQRIRAQGHGEDANLGYWDNPADWASWRIAVAEPGRFEVSARVASVRKENVFAVELAGQKLIGKAPKPQVGRIFRSTGPGVFGVKARVPIQMATVRGRLGRREA